MSKHRVHECGWCAAWRELAAAYDEGRRVEALGEAQRLLRIHPDAKSCLVGVFAVGCWRRWGDKPGGAA